MGQIEINHTGSGGGVVLSSDGTDLLLGGSAIGGSPDLFAENYDGTSTLPSATGTNALSLAPLSTSTGINSVSIGSSADATGNQAFSFGVGSTASGLRSLSWGSSSYTTATDAIAIGSSAQAQSTGGMALGHDATVISGAQAVAIGDSYASGTDSFAAAIANNTSSYGAIGANSVAIGYQAKASASYAFAVGQGNIASAFGSVAIGRNSTASGNYSVTLGNQAIAAQQSKMAYSAGRFATDGDAQTGTFVLRSDTTDATAEALTTSNGTAGTTNQVVLPNNSVYGFTGTIIARENSAATNDFAIWEVKGGAVRGSSASTTALGSYNINTISESTGAANWSIAISADTTNGAIAFTVTGEASHSIRWVATINTTEVTY